MRCLSSITFAVVLSAPFTLRAEDKPIDVSLGDPKYRLIGKLHEPLGTVLTLQGVIVEGPFKGTEGGPTLWVRRINGRATQEDLRIKLERYFHDFGEKALTGGHELPKLEDGKSYEFEGYETGHFVGVPRDAYKRAGIMLQVPVGQCFVHRFTVYKGAKIDPIHWSPTDFIDRKALLAGRAESRGGKAYIAATGWRLLVDANAGWPKEMQDKEVEGFGKVLKIDGPGEFRMENADTRLVRLKDQLGRAVVLRGTAWSMNGHWWLDYRGTDLYVEGMKDLPGWKTDLHGQPVLISGILDEAMLPALDQITLKERPDRKKYFIVRKVSWKPVDALLSPERAEGQ